MKYSPQWSRFTSYVILVCASAFACGVQGAESAASEKPFEPVVGQAGRDVVWVPTPDVLVEKMLDVAKVTPQDFVMDLVDGLSVADGAATLTAFTAQSIARAREHFPEEPLLWVVCGGGRRNKTLMSMLAARVENAVVPAEAVGLDGDAIEAEAWAYLAIRSLLKLPITFPGTTGVDQPTTGGILARAAK